MLLKIAKRSANTKGETKQIRRLGKIPAVLYSSDSSKKAENLIVDGAAFQQALKTIKSGSLSTCVFQLEKEDGSKTAAIVKDISYHITSYRIIHLDFQELQDDREVSVNVPIRFTGASDCAGVKIGGVLRQVIRKLKVRCLPKNIPGQFELNVASLNLGQSMKLSEIALPPKVHPVTKNLDEVAVVIARR